MTTPKTAHERAMRSAKERIGATATVEEVVPAYLAALEREGWKLVPPYPEGEVVGPCVCGSWPGGECLRCPLAAASSAQEEE